MFDFDKLVMVNSEDQNGQLLESVSVLYGENELPVTLMDMLVLDEKFKIKLDSELVENNWNVWFAILLDTGDNMAIALPKTPLFIPGIRTVESCN